MINIKKLNILLIILIILVLVVTINALIFNKSNFSITNDLINVKAESYMDGLDNSWPMYAHDRQHTGRTNLTGPQTNNTNWNISIIGLHNQTVVEEVGSGTIAAPPSIGTDGTIYLVASPYVMTGNEFNLYAIKPDGTLKWISNSTIEDAGYGGIYASTPLISSNKTVYVISDTFLYAFDYDGVLKWKYEIPDGFDGTSGGPIIGKDGTIYFVNGEKLFAINQDGNLKWRDNRDNISVSPDCNLAIGPDGNIYCVGVKDSFPGNIILNAVNSDGTKKWTYDAGMGSFISSPVIADDGTIYICTDTAYQDGSQRFLALNPDGSEKWNYLIECGEFPQFVPPVIGKDGTIYFAVKPDMIYALNPDGSLKWKYTSDYGDCPNSPMIIDDENNLYFASNYYYCLSSNGTLKWRYFVGDECIPPVIGSNGTLYAAGQNFGILYLLSDKK